MRHFARWSNYLCSSRGIHFSHLRWGTVIPYKLTDIGEGIKQVEVMTVYVKSGDKVEEFDKICEVQSDKAIVDITSRYSGVIKSVHVNAGGTALVGQPLVDIELQNEVENVVSNSDGATKVESDAQAPRKTTTDANEKLATSTTTTTTTNDNDKASEKTAATEITASTFSPPSSSATTVPKKQLATPATRAFARECGIDLARIAGTGTDGRVIKEDVSAHAETMGNDAGDVVVPLLKGIRRLMVVSMTEAGNIPSFTASDEVEITALLNFRERVKTLMISRFDKDANLKVSLLPCMLKAASLALLQYPEINAHTSRDCECLIVKKAHNIGFAVDSPRGLIVPVVRNVEQKTIMDLVQEVNELVESGRKNQIPPDRMRGGTFIISNVGSIGATYTTPMLLPPQVAICAIGRMQVLPRFDAQGNVVKANVVQISSTADHRVIDGATLVRFNNAFKKALEFPELILSGIEENIS